MPQFSEIKESYRLELSNLYSNSEIKQLIKLITVNVLDINDIDYILLNNDEISDKNTERFNFFLNGLRNGEPFQYLIGHTQFYNLQIQTDARALIPRPETEELVRWVLESSAESDSIVDLCSGTGCIALALKSNLIDSKVSAIELSNEALELIKENAVHNQIDISIIKGDVLDDHFYEVFGEGTLECIVSNPPYIPQSDKEMMSDNVLKHEPEMALFVHDQEPLIFYEAIAKNAQVVLKDGGRLFFEIHERYAPDVVALLDGIGFVNIELRKDLQGKDRMIKAIK